MKNLPSARERLHSVVECAEVLHADERTVRRWIKRGEIPARKMKRQWYVSELDLRNFVSTLPLRKTSRP